MCSIVLSLKMIEHHTTAKTAFLWVYITGGLSVSLNIETEVTVS